VKAHDGIFTTIYEDDLKNVGGGDPRIRRYISIGFKGKVMKVRPNPGKRPPRKPGESPLA
jgi:hypothetical protein